MLLQQHAWPCGWYMGWLGVIASSENQRKSYLFYSNNVLEIARSWGSKEVGGTVGWMEARDKNRRRFLLGSFRRTVFTFTII